MTRLRCTKKKTERRAEGGWVELAKRVSVRSEPLSRLRFGEITPHPSNSTELLSVLPRERLEGRRVGVDPFVVRHSVDGVEDGGMEGGAMGEGEEDGFN